MEENIQINRFIRWSGIALCVVIILITGLSIFSDNKMSIFEIFSNIGLLVLFLPTCILGYIPGSLLDRLPNFLVNLIKLEPNYR